MPDIFDRMKERWPSAILARRDVPKFTGGAMSAKHLANLDSQGQGPANRFRIGRNVCYPVEDFVAWLRERQKERRKET